MGSPEPQKLSFRHGTTAGFATPSNVSVRQRATMNGMTDSAENVILTRSYYGLTTFSQKWSF